MSNLFTRVSRRVKMTITKFQDDLHFSSYYACLRVADELGGRLRLHRLSNWAKIQRNDWIMRYLGTQLAPVLEQYADNSETGQAVANAPVWVCWWTGEDTAPPLVRQCIRSIRKHANGHPVNMITEKNYQDYLKIPEYIMEKVRNKSMCLANFSDYLRFSLLEKYGGLWLDATIFCSKPLDEHYFHMPVFTCKGRTGDGKYISDYRWTSFCMGGFQNQVLFHYMRTAFEHYWKDNDLAVDYLLVDCLIYLGYMNISAVRRFLDQIPENNMHRDDLQAAMNQALPAEQWNDVVTQETGLYKLSWRESYQVRTVSGSVSIYGHFLNMQQ